MMHKGEFRLPYYQKDGLCGVSLPYGDGSKVMNILIPVREEGSEESEEKSRQKASASELFQGLRQEEKNEFLTNIMNADTIEVRRLQIPKFCMDHTVTELSSLLEEMEYIEFIVDRPFLFTIQDKETGIILFMGQVNNLEGTE